MNVNVDFGVEVSLPCAIGVVISGVVISGDIVVISGGRVVISGGSVATSSVCVERCCLNTDASLLPFLPPSPPFLPSPPFPPSLAPSLFSFPPFPS
eukprot:3936924-Rhodomonas_salina.3